MGFRFLEFRGLRIWGLGFGGFGFWVLGSRVQDFWGLGLWAIENPRVNGEMQEDDCRGHVPKP